MRIYEKTLAKVGTLNPNSDIFVWRCNHSTPTWEITLSHLGNYNVMASPEFVALTGTPNFPKTYTYCPSLPLDL